MTAKNYRVFYITRINGTRYYTVVDKYNRVVIITRQKVIADKYLN